MCEPNAPDIPLPSGWAKNVKSTVLHVISLAYYAIVAARCHGAGQNRPGVGGLELASLWERFVTYFVGWGQGDSLAFSFLAVRSFRR